MDDLISRMSLRESIVASLILGGKKTLDQIIDEEPSVDAVKVVRCKDCKHRYHSVECPCQSYDHFYSWMPADDWFCKNGERKEE